MRVLILAPFMCADDFNPSPGTEKVPGAGHRGLWLRCVKYLPKGEIIEGNEADKSSMADQGRYRILEIR